LKKLSREMLIIQPVLSLYRDLLAHYIFLVGPDSTKVMSLLGADE